MSSTFQTINEKINLSEIIKSNLDLLDFNLYDFNLINVINGKYFNFIYKDFYFFTLIFKNDPYKINFNINDFSINNFSVNSLKINSLGTNNFNINYFNRNDFMLIDFNKNGFNKSKENEFIKNKNNKLNLSLNQTYLYTGYFSLYYGSLFFSGSSSLFPYTPEHKTNNLVLKIKKYSGNFSNLYFGYALYKSFKNIVYVIYQSFDNSFIYTFNDNTGNDNTNSDATSFIYNKDNPFYYQSPKNIGILFLYNNSLFINKIENHLNVLQGFSYNNSLLEINNIEFENYFKYLLSINLYNKSFNILFEPVLYLVKKYNTNFYDINCFFRIEFLNIKFETIFKDTSEPSYYYFEKSKAISLSFKTDNFLMFNIFTAINYYFDEGEYDINFNFINNSLKLKFFDYLKISIRNDLVSNDNNDDNSDNSNFNNNLNYVFNSKIRLILFSSKFLKVFNTIEYDFNNSFYNVFKVIYKNEIVKLTLLNFINKYKSNKMLIFDKGVKYDFDMKYIYPDSYGFGVLLSFNIKNLEKQKYNLNKKKYNKKKYSNNRIINIVYFKFFLPVIDNKGEPEFKIGIYYKF